MTFLTQITERCHCGAVISLYDGVRMGRCCDEVLLRHGLPPQDVILIMVTLFVTVMMA